MNISSLLIYADALRAKDICAQLEQLTGVEVHAFTAEGRLIVTVETDDERQMKQTFEQMGSISGVQATMLVYQHSETLDDESPAKKESKP